MKNEDVKKDTKTETVKIKCKHPMRNRMITPEIYQELEKEYMSELEIQFGRKMILPNMESMLNMKAQVKYGLPITFDCNQIYEVPKEDAEYYLSLETDCIVGERPRVIAKEDLQYYTQKYKYAELVA